MAAALFRGESDFYKGHEAEGGLDISLDIMHDIVYIQYVYIYIDVDPCCDGELSCLHEIWFGKSSSTCYPSLHSVPK